jgi:hypothetical protein
MYTSARSLIDRLMIKILHRNKNNNDIDDVEALVYINEAMREVYRWFALYLPGHVKKSFSYDMVAGESVVALPYPVVSIQSLSINGFGFIPSGPMVPGRQKGYSLTGFNEVRLDNYDAQQGDRLTVEYMPASLPELIIPTTTNPLVEGVTTDKSLFPAILDDVVIGHAHVSYAVARGMIADQENSLRSKYMAQISAIFSDAIQVTSIGEYHHGYAPDGFML